MIHLTLLLRQINKQFKLFRGRTLSSRYFDDACYTVLYQKYRPSPPDVIFETLMQYLAEKLEGPYDLAIDLGCGPGQSTIPLAKYFTCVIGSDNSLEQIKRARSGSNLPNVSFEYGSYKNIYAANSSVELVTAGSSIHWFDLDIFYKELDRVLKPNGILAFYHPMHPDISHADYPELNTDYQNFIKKEIDIFNLDESIFSQSHYNGIKVPYSNAKFYRDDDCFLLRKDMPLTHLLDYIRTWSAYRVYLKQKKDDKDILENLQNSILQQFRTESPDSVILKVTWKYCLILDRKPA